MQNDLEETVIAAFMCNQPVIIVEGQDFMIECLAC